MTHLELVDDVVAEILRQSSERKPIFTGEINEITRFVLDRLEQGPPNAIVPFILTALRLMRDGQTYSYANCVLHPAVGNLLRRKLTFTETQVLEMIDLVSVQHQPFPYKGILSAAASVPMSDPMRQALGRLRPCITEYLGGGEMRDLHARIDILISGVTPQTSLEVQGAWSQIVFQQIAQSSYRSAWEAVFLHTAKLKSGEPPKSWRVAAQVLVEALGRDTFLDAAACWLALGPSPNRPGVQISSGEAEFQTGFLWFLADEADERMPSLLAGFARAALKKIVMLGAVSQKVGNACVNVLAELPGLEPVSQLCGLAQTIKYDTAQRLIEKALSRAAQRAGVSREELDDMSVSACGLGSDGTLRQQFGDYGMLLSICETTSTSVLFTDPQGKPLKSVPAYVKSHHADEWKDLQRTTKDIEKLLIAHRARIERLLLSQRPLSIETLRTCYLNHPLLSGISRRLIWQFDSGLGIWHEGRVVDDVGREIPLTSQQSACLWHPASSDVATILHWRCWLEDHDIRQPFKQAHREVYLITDAERETHNYSNRFAAHILRQHIFAALCEQRGWAFRLMGQWDSHNTPTLALPQFGLEVQYDVAFPHNENEVSGHYVYLLIRTASVSFFGDDRIARPLESIPPIVFSEVMRDVDLFTGAASIASDPAWLQSGSAPFREYWSAFSFGELTEMALNRRTVLERLLPRLALADRCHLDGRFLVVRGSRTTYRIHLGSGNVLMDPGGYLCIVEGATTKASPRHVALPFEGDHQLSLILSKAFLLADDRKIKDQSIARQLPQDAPLSSR